MQYSKYQPTKGAIMFSFSPVQIELSYLIAKADHVQLKIAKAKANKKSTKQLKEQLQLTQNLIKQLKIRLNATIE